MLEAASILAQARREGGLTQAELARRLGVSQAAVAKLERPGSNPTVATLDRALRATGHRLELTAPEWHSDVDESLVREQLSLSPDERLRRFEYQARESMVRAKAEAARNSAQP